MEKESKTTGPKRKIRAFPWVLALIASTALSDNQAESLSAETLKKARIQSAKTVKECRKSNWLGESSRKAIRCLLSESSLNFQRANLKKNNRPVQFHLTGETVNLGSESYNIGTTKENGDVLLSKNGTVYLVANLENTIENVKAVLMAKKAE